MKTALIAGSTGLIGKQLLELLLEDSYYTKVIAISRKPMNTQHVKLETVVVDFDSLHTHSNSLKADDVFCCLGTTIRIANTKEAFRKVDFEYPVELAQVTKNQGASQYFLVSALGANKKSSVFYNRVKGEVEEAIQRISFPSFHIFRPSLLLGNREKERAGEGAAISFFKVFGFLIPLKYKAIESVKVAKAMIALAKQNQSGLHIHESKELQSY